MTLNAALAEVHAGGAQARRAMLWRRLANGTFGAWYTLQTGPVAELLLARPTTAPHC